MPLAPQALDTFWNACQKYRTVDFDSERADMARDTRRLPHAAYLELAMSHRFCLVAPGDYPSTHKARRSLTCGRSITTLPYAHNSPPVNPRWTPRDAPRTNLVTHRMVRSHEAMALGGAGGCIPVFVLPVREDTTAAHRAARQSAGGRSLPSKLGQAVARTLPYTRWLDYCEVAYLVTERAATLDFSAALRKLRAVTDEEVCAMQATEWRH